jgi:hypothetical protein
MHSAGSRLLCHLMVVWGCLATMTVAAQAQGAPDRRWGQKTSVHVSAQPAAQFLTELCQKHKLPVEFDPEDKKSVDSHLFTLDADGVSLGSVIDLVCESGYLSYTVDQGQLRVTTDGYADTHPYPMTYPLAALGPIPEVSEFAFGIESMTSVPWGETENKYGPQGVTITQSRRIHRQIEQFFVTVGTALAGRPRAPTPQEKAEQALFRKLQFLKPFEGDATHVQAALDQLLTKNGIPVWIDAVTLGDESIDLSQLITVIDPKKLATNVRLDNLLKEHKLAWFIRNEVVQITTQEKLDSHEFVVVYDIRRAITPMRSATQVAEELMANAEYGPWQSVDGDGGYAMAHQSFLIVYHNAARHAKLAAFLR